MKRVNFKDNYVKWTIGFILITVLSVIITIKYNTADFYLASLLLTEILILISVTMICATVVRQFKPHVQWFSVMIVVDLVLLLPTIGLMIYDFIGYINQVAWSGLVVLIFGLFVALPLVIILIICVIVSIIYKRTRHQKNLNAN
ncbi:MAG: hypothetical protein E7291_09010 [Lachnospiraceae bacterium]|nr:hypothetical protein [Lachnospiraceae bacterium]